MKTRRPHAALATASLLAVAAVLATPAAAQDASTIPAPIPATPADAARQREAEQVQPSTSAAEAQAEEAAAAGDIVVTGSRVKRDGYAAPTPETVFSADNIANKAPSNIADAVNQLPQLAGSATPRQATVNLSAASAGSNFLNLRGLGTNRTLVLLDGRRVVGANADGRVDINTLPSALVSRVDIVTGGASAAYGSDAVSGVVNFVLDTRFKGLKLEGQTGVTTYGDDFKYKVEAAGGFGFAGGRGHVIAAVSHSEADGVENAGVRPWFNSSKIIANPAFAAGNGQPQLIRRSNVSLNASTPGGIITSGVLRGTTFADGGAIGQFNYGTTSGIYSLGGTPNDLASTYALDIPLKNTTAFGRVSFDVADALKLFAEFNYGRARAEQPAPFNFHNANLTIQRDNAFLPDALRARLVSAGQTSFSYGNWNTDIGRNIGQNTRELTRYVLGAEGDLGGGWRYDLYGQYGKTDISVRVRQLEISANYRNAIDAVRNAAGQIVCRSTLANPANGCVPFNVFGSGVNSAASIAYVSGVAALDQTLEQRVAAGSIQGEPFSTWAGPVSIVVGAEYRKDEIASTADPISLASGFNAGNYKPTIGRFDVKEAFVEAVVPLLKDSAFGRSLDLNGAYRRTDYSVSGSVDTFKVGVTYQPIDDVRFRGVRSRDIRAPNLNDLYQGGVLSNAQSVIDPFRSNTQTNGIAGTLTGNPTLRPEIARTWSGGVVVSPRFVPGLTVSVDYFDIRINQAIATLTSQQVVDRCFGGNTALCGGITRNAAGAITAITRSPVNINTEGLKGLDIEASYRLDLSAIAASLPGSLTLRSLASYTDTRFVDDGRLRDEQAGENNGAIPKWRVNGSIGFDDDAFSAVFTGRWVSAGVYDKAYTTAILSTDDNRIPGAAYFDLALRFKFEGGAARGEFFFNVDNLFNKDPVIVAPINQQFLVAPVNALLYDTLGREFKAGVRLRY